jgi:hypothetical protein
MALFKINSALFAQDNFYCMNSSAGEEKLKNKINGIQVTALTYCNIEVRTSDLSHGYDTNITL